MFSATNTILCIIFLTGHKRELLCVNFFSEPMSPFAVKAIQLLLSLSILIVLHELGHFIPAKIFKTRVEKFFLFFDVKFALFKKKIGDTVYGIGWLPLGGYVKIAGMIDESMDKDQMEGPPQPWEFRSKPAWQRLIIMLGGVTVNIIVGFVIYMSLLYFYGRDITTNADIPEGFSVASQFKELGFRDGDQILKVNGKDFDNVTQINKYLFLRDVRSVEVKHNDDVVETLSVPEDIGTEMFKNDILRPFEPMRLAVIDTVAPGFPAMEAGFQDGDKVVSVNGDAVGYWHEFTEKIKANKGNESTVVVSRNNRLDTLQVTPSETGAICFDSMIIGKFF